MLSTSAVIFVLLFGVYGAPVQKSGMKQKHFVVQKEDISAVEQELKEQAGEDKKFALTSPVPLLAAMQVDGLADKPTPSTQPHESSDAQPNTALDQSQDRDDNLELTEQDEQFLNAIAQTLKAHPEILDTLANADSREVMEEIARIGEQTNRNYGIQNKDPQEYLIKELEKEKTGLTDTIEKQSSKHIQRNPNAARNHLHPIGTITDGQIKDESSSLGNNERYTGIQHHIQKKGNLI